MTKPPEIRVDVWELRCRFNKGHYWKRAKAGEFTVEVKSHDADPKYKLGPGGQSQEVYYLHPITKIQVVRAHQLLKADGTLGGGGKPDPKVILENGILYHPHKGGKPEDQILKDPSLKYTGVTCWAYKKWRWIKCLLTGK